jgi:hypothetical protein
LGRAAEPAGRRTSYPAGLRATTDLDREGLRHEAAVAIGWGVKSGGERVAAGPGGAVPVPPGVRHRAAGRMTVLDVVAPPSDPTEDGTSMVQVTPDRARDQTAGPA